MREPEAGPSESAELLVVADDVGMALDHLNPAVQDASYAAPPLFETDHQMLRAAAFERASAGRRYRRVRILAEHPAIRARLAAEVAGILPEYDDGGRIWTSTWIMGRPTRWSGEPVLPQPPRLRQRAVQVMDGEPVGLPADAKDFRWYPVAIARPEGGVHVMFVCPHPPSFDYVVEILDTQGSEPRWQHPSRCWAGDITKGWERRPRRWRGEAAVLVGFSSVKGWPLKTATGLAGRDVLSVNASVGRAQERFAVDPVCGAFYVALKGSGPITLTYLGGGEEPLGERVIAELHRAPSRRRPPS